MQVTLTRQVELRAQVESLWPGAARLVWRRR